MLGYLIRFLLNALLFTCRFQVKGIPYIEEAYKKGPLMIVLWHNRLALAGASAVLSPKHLKFCAFVSKSKDGEILASYAESFSRGSTIRVPHTGKSAALKALIERLKERQDIPLITPDGPRGPSMEVKPGVVLAAVAARSALIPFSWKANRFWELKSWDKFRIPLPFSTIEAEFGPPFYLDESAAKEELSARVKEALQALC